jgi:THO complex subunit 1
MKAFEAIPNDDESRPARSAEEPGKNLKRKRGAEGNEAPETFAPKYLTSKDLFELEVSNLYPITDSADTDCMAR